MLNHGALVSIAAAVKKENLTFSTNDQAKNYFLGCGDGLSGHTILACGSDGIQEWANQPVNDCPPNNYCIAANIYRTMNREFNHWGYCTIG